MEATDILSPDLDAAERWLLRCGIVEWGGPARCTEEMAVAMGFRRVQDLFDSSGRLAGLIESGSALTARDWLRVLLATEIVFASNPSFRTVGLGRGDSRCSPALTMLISPQFAHVRNWKTLSARRSRRTSPAARTGSPPASDTCSDRRGPDAEVTLAIHDESHDFILIWGGSERVSEVSGDTERAATALDAGGV